MKINKKNLSKLFKTNISEIDKFCSDKLKTPLYFKYLNLQEYEKVILKILNKTLTDTQIIASRGRKNKWFRGWEESLKNYKNKQYFVSS